jgi:hypothetical protein
MTTRQAAHDARKRASGWRRIPVFLSTDDLERLSTLAVEAGSDPGLQGR